MQRVATGWPRLALSLQVISRKRALKLVALLQKTTCNLQHLMGLHHPARYSIMHALQGVLGFMARSFSLSTTRIAATLSVPFVVGNRPFL